MKTTTLVSVIVCLASGHASYGHPSWGWAFSAQPYAGEVYEGGGFFGCFEDASDGYDSYDYRISPDVGAHIGVYHQAGVAGWTGPTGMWRGDTRSATLSPLSLPQVWDFYVWMDPESPDSLTAITVSGMGGNPAPPPYTKVTLRFLRNAVGAPDNPDVGAVWSLLDYPWGPTNPDAHVFATVPAYRTDDGRNGYLFRMTAEVIPEPSSLVAMGLLTGSLCTLAKRRRGGVRCGHLEA